MTNMIKIAKGTKVYLYIIYMVFFYIGFSRLGCVEGDLALISVVVVRPGQPPSHWLLGVYHAIMTFVLGVLVRLAGLGSINCIDTSPNFPL